MSKRTLMLKGLSLGLATTMVFAGCGNLVVKVQKKPKDVNLASLENFSSLNLTNSEDFLKQLDALKVIGIDLIIKEIADRNYRADVRSAIRNYRKYLIEKGSAVSANGPYGGSENAFYYSKDECRKMGLSFNIDQANNFLGLILKTGVLAKISEVSAGKLNPALQGASKQLAAVAQLILIELGIKISGDVDVTEENDLKTTSGSFTLQLTEIKGENLDPKTKEEDATQILGIGFKRSLGSNTQGSFDASVQVVHKNAAGNLETLTGAFKVERKSINDLFVHEAQFNLGIKGKDPSYYRTMKFEQMPADKKQLKVTDSYKTATSKAETYVTVLNVEKGTQCKFQVGSAELPGKDGIYGDSKNSPKGSEGPYTPQPGGKGGEAPIGEGKEPSPTPPKNPPPPEATATGTKTNTNTSTTTTPPPPPPTVDKDGEKPPVKGGGTVTPPSQNPTQTPGQNPSQSK